MKGNKVEIKKVVLEVGGKEIQLTIEEAKELQELLNKTFGENKNTITIPCPYPVYPDYPWRLWRVTCAVSSQNVPISGTYTNKTDTMYISTNIPR